MAGVLCALAVPARVHLLLLGLGLAVGCGQAMGGSEDHVPASAGGPSTGGRSQSMTGGESTAPRGGVAATGGGASVSGAGAVVASYGGSFGGAGAASAGGASTGGSSSEGGTTSGGSEGADTGGSGSPGGGSSGGTGGETSGGTSGEGGNAGEAASDPYAPRSGPFKALVYSRTQHYRTQSISSAQETLEALAVEHGFQVTLTESKDDFTAEKLAAHELVVFLHTTGDVLDAAQEEVFEDWMVNHDGAFVGIGHAADAEFAWDFYKELMGQSSDGLSPCCPESDVTWTPEALAFPAVRGMPSPWRTQGLWFLMSKMAEWSEKPGFTILGTVTYTRFDEVFVTPVSFAREFGNFRSFYAGFGHSLHDFEDANLRKYIAAGILWSVRREQLIP